MIDQCLQLKETYVKTLFIIFIIYACQLYTLLFVKRIKLLLTCISYVKEEITLD